MAETKSQSKYPDDLRAYVYNAYENGVRCTDIAARVRELWPQYPRFSHNSAGMMVGARKGTFTRSERAQQKAKHTISLGGPSWSWPKQKEPAQ